jgi:hypothetical protein
LPSPPPLPGLRKEFPTPADPRTQWIPAPHLAAEFGITRRTLARWLCNEALGLPRPRCVNHRLYFERSAVEAWKAATSLKATRAAVEGA